MQDIRRVFDERDTDKSGRIDMCEMSAAMKGLKVNLSEDEVKTLFKVRHTQRKRHTHTHTRHVYSLQDQGIQRNLAVK